MERVRPAAPVAPWLGGKKRLHPLIIGRIEAIAHQTYVEPFVGMGGVFLRRRFRPRLEVANDRNGEIVNLFRILQRHLPQLMEVMRFSVASRREFERLRETDPATLTDLERAARFLYLQRLAFGGQVAGVFGVAPSHGPRFSLARLEPILEAAHERLEGVVFECLDWAELIQRYDGAGTLFYLDPPYWGGEDDYGKGLFDRAQFARLAEVLAAIRAGASSINYLPAFTPGGTNSTFIFNGTRFSCKDLNPDAAYWVDMIVVGAYKSAVFYNCVWDGYYNGLMIGRGWQTWCKNLHFRNNLADNVQIGAALATAAAAHTGASKSVTAVTNANPAVVTCPNHGLLVGDSFIVTGATGMTQINTTPRMVYAVIDANNFQLGDRPSTGPDAAVPTDATAWGVYTGSGVLNGPLYCNLFFENIYHGPQADDARFAATHSDGTQSGSPSNEVGFKGNFFDIVFNLKAATTSPVTTQGFFGAGAETDGTIKRYRVKNILSITTTLNGISAATTEDWQSEMSYCTVLHHATLANPSLGATFKQAAKKNFAKSVINGDYVNLGGGVITHNINTVVPATDLNTVFDGNFAADGRGYYFDSDPEPTGTVPEILQAFANRYKGVGAYTNMGFGADPDSWLFNGTVLSTPAVISGVSVTPAISTADVNWSCDVGAGFVYRVLSTSNALTQSDVISAAMNGHASVVGSNRSVVGLTASGAQPAFACTGLSPATTYYAYLVVERLHGAKTFSGAITVTTNALAGTIQYLGEVIRNGAAAGSISLTGLSLQQNDMVLVMDTATSNATTRTVGVSTAGYTDIAAKITSNDTYDTNSIVQRKFMGATPDTTVDMLSTANSTDARKTIVRAYRYVDQTTPIDVTAVTASGVNGILPNLGAITPNTVDALIVCYGVGASINGSTTVFNAPSDLVDWTSQALNTAAFNNTSGVGHKLWASGAFDPEAWTGPSSAATDSWSGWTIALRPLP